MAVGSFGVGTEVFGLVVRVDSINVAVGELILVDGELSDAPVLVLCLLAVAFWASEPIQAHNIHSPNVPDTTPVIILFRGRLVTHAAKRFREG